MNKYVEALRPKHWYKNILIFIPLLLSLQLFNYKLYPSLIIGFICLGLMSSAGYLFNDILDIDKDRLNPEKKNRPIASGRVSKVKGWILHLILSVSSGVIATIAFRLLSSMYVVLHVNNLLYTSKFKHRFLLDVYSISFNYILRLFIGASIIGYTMSYWVYLGVFFFAMFMVIGKRIGEAKLLGKDSTHRTTLKQYGSQLSKSILILVSTVFFISYTFYAIELSSLMVITIPLVLYLVIEYMNLLENDPIKVRDAYQLIKDKSFLSVLSIFGIMSIIILYVM